MGAGLLSQLRIGLLQLDGCRAPELCLPCTPPLPYGLACHPATLPSSFCPVWVAQGPGLLRDGQCEGSQ